jgi:hypothetical protein
MELLLRVSRKLIVYGAILDLITLEVDRSETSITYSLLYFLKISIIVLSLPCTLESSSN